MRLQIKQTRCTPPLNVDVDIKSHEEDFVGLLDISGSPKLRPLVETASRGLQKGFAPELSEDGVGGTYFLHDERNNKIGVFKPQDEEPYNDNNPKGYGRRKDSFSGMKCGILVGEASVRECAAYLLDHGNYAGVPVTDLALCKHSAFHWNNEEDPADEMSPFLQRKSQVHDQTATDRKTRRMPPRLKIGSLQAFVDHDGDCEDIGRRMLAQFPVGQVHKIAQLDVRLFNTDRHGGNILYREDVDDLGRDFYELIPIDHGYTLPSTLDEASFVWLDWPQAHEPMSQETRAYIAQLDVQKDLALLKEKFHDHPAVRPEHLHVFHLGTLVLQSGTRAGCTFHQIGSVLVREGPSVPSVLERLCSRAQSSSHVPSARPSLTSSVTDSDLRTSGSAIDDPRPTSSPCASATYDDGFYARLSELLDEHFKKLPSDDSMCSSVHQNPREDFQQFHMD